ncbi:hypothetical protein B296_00031739 [Ensete ventricosum]|uniref:protein-serine/threonine phosphatase n=1 Tax=Ensete ventricosum TaxID=4639 RepID=A0A427AFI9_ENSVE|nr:hypothetical protein B296_00031739 [Ensete ventricosum]
MDEMPPALALPSQVGSSLCDSALEGARRKRSAEAEGLPSNPMPASGSGSAADVEQTEVMAPVPSALEEDGDDLEVRTIPGSDEEDPLSIEPEMSAGSSSSVVSDSSNLSCAIDEFSISDSSGEMGTPSSMDVGTVHGNAVPGPASWELGANPLAVSMNVATPSIIELGNPESRRGGDGSHLQSLLLMERLPLWGFVTICGRRPEMEDAVVVVPHFFEVPLWMLIGDQSMDGLDPDVIRIPLHFFGVYDGHGGAQVLSFWLKHSLLLPIAVEAIIAETGKSVGLLYGLLSNIVDLGGTSHSDWKKHWEKAFVDCFQKVDDQVGGKESRGNMGSTAEAQSEGDMLCPNVLIEAVAPETVGSTAVVAVVCSSHIIIANCGDSRAVLCRDRYLKPWIIPEPEVTIVPRAREDECLILASDGLWDVMSNEEVCDVARRRILLWHKKNGPVSAATQRGEGTDPAAQAAAECLSRLAVQKGSKDNITVIVVDLKAQRKFKSKS